ncbi:MAG: leucine-rich repeat domain-containing protein [Bacteroidales bacterium]|nr:leucine-rich repeat domain-containing protein [Bacteroidales bacterium]
MEGINVIENNNGYNVLTLGDLRDNPLVGLYADYIADYDAGYYLTFNLINNQTELSLKKYRINSDYEDGNEYSVTIPTKVAGFPVTQICDDAFKDCKSLKEIIIPKTVSRIGEGCFAGCKNLQSIIVEEGNKNYDSRNNCNAIIQTDGNVLIAGCRNTIIPSSVTEIGDFAFCGSLFEQLIIPQSIIRIGNSAFSECSLLTSLTIPESVIKIGDKAFSECRDLEQIKLPHSITRIGNETFANCQSITNLEIPLSVEEIGDDAFYKCKKLEHIELHKLITKIGNKAFYGCENLSSLTIPASVTEISDGVFCKCKNLKNIYIPESVNRIGIAAFLCCTSLTYVRIPFHVTEIDDQAFCKCINVKRIIICSNSLSRIGNETFADCRSLFYINIPESVTEIGKSAFAGCIGLTGISIPSKVTKINDSTFDCCENLDYVILPDSIKTIGNNAFRVCKKLKTIVLPDSMTGIGESAFYECSSLQRLDIPESITKLAQAVFVHCKSLTSIKIPKSIIEIGDNILWGCDNIAEIIVDRDNVCYDSRENCNAIIETATNKLIRGCCKTIIPDSVQTIGSGAFSYCKNLDKISIPSSVSSIEDAAFCNCSDLTELYIPYSVKKVGSKVFDECKNLQKITISDPSLLLESGISKNVKFEYSYEDITAYLYNNHLKDSINAEYVKLVSKIPFTKIINSFADQLSNMVTNPKYYNKALLSSIIDNVNYLLHINFGFIKYIHIYNHIGKNQIGNINLYIDFTQEKITDSRKELCNGNMVFDDHSLIYLLQNNYIALIGGIMVECCNSSNMGVLDTNYYPVINASSDNEQEKFSAYLKQFFKIDDDKKLSKDLKTLFSQPESTGITNYYFLGNYGEKLDKTYSLWANIGIDSTNVTNKECIKAFLETFRQFLNAISTNLQFGGVRTQELRNKAVESAISQSDLRNTAHNLGAHVLSRFDANKYSQEDINLFVRSYLNCRINYLGEKTFGTPQMLTTRMLYRDILHDFENQKILLDNIAGIAGFKPKFNFLYNGKLLDYEHDIPVAMPADVYGIMALYNLVENIIRNSAKHGNNSDAQATLTIEFSDQKINNPSDYYCIEIDTGIKEKHIDTLVVDINKYINTSVLNSEFKLRDRNLGLVEMAASAAFLRKLDATTIDSYDYRFDPKTDKDFNDEGNLIIFRAINKNGALGYRLWALKPTEYLFVGNWSESIQKQQLKQIGIDFVDENTFADNLSNGFSYSHQFIIYKNNISNKTKNLLSDTSDYKTLLTLRKIQVSSNEANELINKLNNKNNKDIIEVLSDFAWTHWCGNTDDNLYIGATPDEDNMDSCDQLIFLNHAYKSYHSDIVELKSNSHELWVENLSSYTERKLPHYAELSTYQQGHKSLFQTYLNNLNKQIKYELYEAYRNKVVVIDERIQKFSNTATEGSSNNESGPIPCSALFESTNVVIPDIPLAPKVFDKEIIKNIETELDKNIDNAFLLVHYGILERMYEGDEEIITQKLIAWSKKAKRVIVTSGRGSHSLSLPKSVCYTNLASVLRAFCEHRNKYLINYLLNQSRRKDE